MAKNGWRTRSGVIGVALAGVALMVLSACSSSGDKGSSNGSSAAGSSAPNGGKTTNVTFLLPFQHSLGFYPVDVAQAMGYFKDEGLNVSIKPTDGSSFVVQQILAGHAEAGLATASSIMLGAQDHAADLKAIYGLYTSAYINIYTLADSPINTVEDLKGHVVGVNDLAGGEALDARLLVAAKQLSPTSDVRFQAVGFAAAGQVEALQSKRIDAIAVTLDPLSSYDVLGIKYKCISCDSQPLGETSVVVSKSFLANKAAAEGLGRALARATLYAETNPGAALKIMQKAAPAQTENFAAASLFMNKMVDVTRPAAGQGFGMMNIEAWDNRMNLMLTAGGQVGLRKSVDVNSIVSNDLVPQFNSFNHDAVVAEANPAAGSIAPSATPSG